jgi:Amino acid permease
MEPVRQEPALRSPHFRLWDTICIIVGIIIGIGIFQTPPGIFARSDSSLQALGVWVLGGSLCIVGGLCFAELAATYPRSGGEYVYLTRVWPVGWISLRLGPAFNSPDRRQHRSAGLRHGRVRAEAGPGGGEPPWR